LLKLVHAQRLLPLEQILSETGPQPSSSTARTAARVRTEPPRAAAPSPGTPSSRPSPFETDRARKSAASSEWESPRTPKAETQLPTAQADSESTGESMQAGSAIAVAVESAEIAPQVLQSEVIEALERANSRTPIVEVGAEGGELIIKVGVAQTLVDAGLALSEEAKRAALAAAARVLGRPVRLRIIGGPGNGNPRATAAPPPQNGPGARGRAADDPVVQRMREKFSAQIRTVIDHREKR
jgi:DNA polymerase-3 subunit gamma/tau